MHTGILLIISGPSGVGKGTVIKQLLGLDGFSVSVSATTRKPRIGERNCIDYFFLKRDEFEKYIKNGDMIEYNEYCGNFYGTIKTKLNELLNKNDVVLLEIDVNGALKISEKMDVVKIFLLPPSLKELKNRLSGRKTETTVSLNKRLKKAYFEIEKAKAYDYIIVNDSIENVVCKIKSIVESENLKVKRKSIELKELLKETFEEGFYEK